MARRVVGERKGERQLEMLLAGEPRPVELDASWTWLPPAYRALMTMWGPGVAYGSLALADPSDPVGPFAQWQRRYRVHARHLIIAKRWWVQETAIEDVIQAMVLVVGDGHAVAVTRARNPAVYIVSPTGAHLSPGFAEALRALRDRMVRPAPYYRTKPSQRDALVASIRAGNDRLVDGLFAAVLEEESVKGMLALALALVREPDASRYDSYVRRAMEPLARWRPDSFARIANDLVDRSNESRHRDAVARLAQLVEPFDMLGGDTDPTEVALELAALAKPAEEEARLALLEHYEQRGRNALADLARAAVDMTPPELARRYGAMPLDATSCDLMVAQWRDAWTTGDPTVDVDALMAEIAKLDRAHYRAIVNCIVREDEERLRRDPAAPLLTLALRTRHAVVAARAIKELRAKTAAPYLWSALARRTRPLHLHTEADDEERLELAAAFARVGRLTPEQVTEVLGWIDRAGPRARTQTAFCVLRREATDDRVLDMALRHFMLGSPYTEPILAKRDDARVDETLWAAFEREEAKVLEGTNFVRYTPEYGLLARFLATRGHERAAAAYERFKTKARMDRAAENWIDWDDM